MSFGESYTKIEIIDENDTVIGTMDFYNCDPEGVEDEARWVMTQHEIDKVYIREVHYQEIDQEDERMVTL